MIAVMGVSAKDSKLAVDWLNWHLDMPQPPSRHELMFGFARSVPAGDYAEIEQSMSSRSTFILHDENEAGYPISASHLFVRCMEFVSAFRPRQPILWLEPDAIPVKPGWLDAIADEYEICGKPFMGHLEPLCRPPHLAGVAVYPPNWEKLAPNLYKVLEAGDIPTWGPGLGQAFDMYAGPQIYPQAAQSKTIQQVWKCPPFTEDNLDLVKPDTYLFHQCKDGSLIRELRKNQFHEA